MADDANDGLETVELGGHIRLSGFKDVDYADVIVVKKLVGNYAKKFNTMCDVTEFAVRLKDVHKIEGNQKFEIGVKLLADGKHYGAETVDKNLYVALDTACKKVMNSLKP